MSTPSDEIRTTVERLLAINEAGDEFMRFTDSSQPLARLAEVARRQSAAVFPGASRVPIEVPSRALGELFGPIRVNPNSERRTELIMRSFVYGKPGALPLAYRSALPINGSDDEIKAFVQMAITRAKAQFSVHHASVADYRRFDVVLGDRGIGKTFFQNNLLSRFSRHFDEQRVLYVRINLLRDFFQEGDGQGPWQSSIDHWVKSQIAKVVCRYYDPASNAPGLIPKPEHLTLNFGQVVNDSLIYAPFHHGKVREHCRHMLSIFRLTHAKAESDLDSGTVDPFVADAIFQAVLEKMKMAIIVVFDGLDLLGYTDLSKARYQKILKLLAAYLASDAAPYRYHIVFIRPETLQDFEEQVLDKQQLDPILDGNPFGEGYFGLRPVDPRAVWRQRFVALSQESMIKHYDIDLEQLKAFNRFLVEPRPDSSGAMSNRSYGDAIAEIGGHNARSCVNLVHLAYHSFLTTLGPTADPAKPYQMTEMMMLAGQEFPPANYHYRAESTGHFKKSMAPRWYETDFLPSIFRAPIVVGLTARELYGGTGVGQVLLVLRVLQLIEACTRPSQETGYDTGVSAMKIRQLADELFEYNDYDVQRTLEELTEEELIHPSRRLELHLPSPVDQLLRLAPKGRLILENLVQDLTYLSLACYNLPLPQCMILGKDADRYFRAVTPGSNAQWIVAKIWNSFSLFQILRKANDFQHRRLMERESQQLIGPQWREVLARAQDEISTAHGGLFTFVDKIERRLLDLADRILRSVKQNSDLYEEVRRAIDTFG